MDSVVHFSDDMFVDEEGLQLEFMDEFLNYNAHEDDDVRLTQSPVHKSPRVTSTQNLHHLLAPTPSNQTEMGSCIGSEHWLADDAEPEADASVAALLFKRGIVVSTRRPMNYPTVQVIDASHPAIKDFAHVRAGDYVTKINGHTVREWTNKYMYEYINSNDITALHSIPPAQFRSEQSAVHKSTRATKLHTVKAVKRQQQLMCTERIAVQWTHPCKYKCGFTHLVTATKGEKLLCCQAGKLAQRGSAYELKPFPRAILSTIEKNAAHLSKASPVYNNMLAMGSIGVENDHGGGFEKGMAGDHCVKMNGSLYHYFSKATNESARASGGISYFTFDTASALMARAAEVLPEGQQFSHQGTIYDTIQTTLLQKFKTEMLKVNLFSQRLRNVGDRAKSLPSGTPLASMIATLNDHAEYLEVAHITSAHVAGNKILNITYKGFNKHDIVRMDDPSVEPLCYPLLYFCGERGWGNRNHTVPFPKYMASRMLMPEPKRNARGHIQLDRHGNRVLFTLPALEGGAGTRIPCNRFQAFARLGQYFLVQEFSRALDFRLDWVRSHQQTIFCGGQRPTREYHHGDMDGGDVNFDDDEDSDSDQDADDAELAASRKTHTPDFLPGSFFGSRRNLKRKALNALAIVSDIGKATGFLTLTCNTNWPEIRERLLVGQSAFDRPDVTCMVFKHRLTKFLDKLERGHFFPDKNMKVAYIMRVIEYQNRGLPHAHVVFRIADTPEETDVPATVRFIDQLISAEMPVPRAGSATYAADVKYAELVRTHMRHKCAVNVCRKTAECACKRGYSDTSNLQPTTTLRDDGYAEYRRRSSADRRIVPHNRAMLMAWDGHCNLEYAAGVKSVMYLYKYLYKGVKTIRANIGRFGEALDPLPPDETDLYLKGRFLCAMDAMWRILGYCTYPATKPKVRVIKVKTREQVKYLLRQGLSCDMHVYFSRPEQLKQYRYCELFKEFTVNNELPRRFHSKPHLRNVDYFEITYAPQQNDEQPFAIYLCRRRKTPYPTITRMEMLYVTSGDPWYLRLILLHQNPMTFEDAMSHDGRHFPTFQQAAIAKGLVQDKNEAFSCFDELQHYCTPFELRGVFCVMLVHGFPMLCVYDHQPFRAKMMEDFPAADSIKVRTNKFLSELQLRLEGSGGKTLTEYGFPEPVSDSTELAREQLKYDPDEQKALLADLESKYPNNEEQQAAFDEIMSCVEHADDLTKCKLFFISSPGGVGKSELCKKLHAAIRSKDKLIKVCAATTLAATLFPGAETAHSTFKFPVTEDDVDDLDEPMECKLENTQRLQLLSECVAIFWDEFVSNHKNLFEAVMDVFKAHNINVIFVCCGDFRQILPVVKFGNIKDQMAATICRSDYWRHFKVLRLKQNMRLTALQTSLPDDAPADMVVDYNTQVEYSKAILALAEGKADGDCIHVSTNDTTKCATMALRGMPFFTANQRDEALQWLFPDGFNTQSVLSTCVLAATNASGDRWNQVIQDSNPDDERIYTSHDYLSEVDDPELHLRRLLSEKLLNSCIVAGVPANKLRLKVNDICLVLRHMTPLDLATNQRVRISKFFDKSVMVETVEDRPRKVFIPRIRFNFNLKYGDSYKVMRTQLPLRLAYCMTYNKSQGQTLGKVLLDVTEDPFAHGQCYVALSRVRSKKDIMLFIAPHRLTSDGHPLIDNVVYTDALINNI